LAGKLKPNGSKKLKELIRLTFTSHKFAEVRVFGPLNVLDIIQLLFGILAGLSVQKDSGYGWVQEKGFSNLRISYI